MMDSVTVAGPPVEGDVRSVLRAQRRRRRVRFWLGFGVILLVGGLWAGLTKDPARPALLDQFGGGGVAEVGVAEEMELVPVPPPDAVVATTVMVGP
jgi:hypothetical protein